MASAQLTERLHRLNVHAQNQLRLARRHMDRDLDIEPGHPEAFIGATVVTPEFRDHVIAVGAANLRVAWATATATAGLIAMAQRGASDRTINAAMDRLLDKAKRAGGTNHHREPIATPLGWPTIDRNTMNTWTAY